jgi:hypothetical protein
MYAAVPFNSEQLWGGEKWHQCGSCRREVGDEEVHDHQQICRAAADGTKNVRKDGFHRLAGV